MDEKTTISEAIAAVLIHDLLSEQLEEHFGGEHSVPGRLEEFVDGVNRAFWQLDAERLLMERAHNLNTRRLDAIRQELQKSHDLLERRVWERTEALLATSKALEREIEERSQIESALTASREGCMKLAHRLGLLTIELTRAEEQERRRIAAALHDSIIQNIAFAKLRIDALQRSGSINNQDGDLSSVQKALTQCVNELRTLMFELSPPVLYEFGIGPALETLADQLSVQSGIAIRTLDFNGNGSGKTGADLDIFLYRAARELVINAIKHARPSTIQISVAAEADAVTITVSDDGAGFDPTASPQSTAPHGFGLFSIRERLRCLRGDLEITTKPGEGTHCCLHVPLPQEAI